MNNKYETAFNTVKNAIETLYAEAQLAAPENQPTALAVLGNLAELVRELESATNRANGYITNVELLSDIRERILKSEHDNPIGDAIVTYYEVKPTSLPIENMRKILIEVGIDGKNRRCLEVSVLTEDNQCVKTAVVIGYIVPHDVDSEFDNGFAAHTIYQSVIKHGNEYINELHTNLDASDKTEKTVELNALMEKTLRILRRKHHIADIIVRAISTEIRTVNANELLDYPCLFACASGDSTVDFHLGKEDSRADTALLVGRVRFFSATPEVTRALVLGNLFECLKIAINSYIEEV